MKIYCLSSLLVSTPPPDPFDDEEVKNTGELLNLSYHHSLEQYSFYDLAKENALIKLLNNANYYAFSEIRIGKRNEIFYFVLLRNNVKYLDIKMKKGSVTICERREAETPVIDLIVNVPFNRHFPLKSIEKITIRMIKNTSSRKLTSKEASIYNEYVNKINENSNGNFELQEEAFNCEGPILNSSGHDGMKRKINDLSKAIKDLCDPKTGSIKNVKKGDRYNGDLDDEDEILIKPDSGGNFSRNEESKNFKECRSLSYDSVTFLKINKRWFEAENLILLSFKNVDVFETYNAWSIFNENVGKLKKLHILEITKCGLKEIPDNLFEALPKSINCLILDDNNLSNISGSISELINLRKLSLKGNIEIEDDGIPWEKLPTSLEVLDLKNIKITKVPNSISRLQNLKMLDVQTKTLQEIDWEAITNKIKNVYISNNNVAMEEKTCKGLTKYASNGKDLKEINYAVIPLKIRLLDLSDNQIEKCDFQKNFWFLNYLDLSNNKLKEIAWEKLPDQLDYINFSNNELTEVGSIKHLKKMTQFHFQHNHIETITSEFNQLERITILNLNHNYLTRLPEGFEFIKHPMYENENVMSLYLGDNKFSPENGDLHEALWNRLPMVLRLNLNGSYLGEIPCKLAGRMNELYVMNCNLHYICPKIMMNKVDINVAKNPKLTTTTFLPQRIHPPIGALSEPTDEIYSSADVREGGSLTMWNVLVSDTKALIKSGKIAEIPEYRFNQVEETNDEMKTHCKCCAFCGKNENTVMVKQRMMMDFVLSVVEEGEPLEQILIMNSFAEDLAETDENFYTLFFKPGWQAGKWKAIVRTRLCNQPDVGPSKRCISQMIKKCNDAIIYNYNENFEEIDSKKPRNDFVNDNNPAWLKYLIEGQEDVMTTFDHVDWPYRYPTQDFLINFCVIHEMELKNYVYSGLELYYEKIVLGKTILLTKKIKNDLNSGYRALAYLLTGDEENHEIIRKIIYNYIIAFTLPQKFYSTYETEISNMNASDMETPLQECEIYAATNLFQVNIMIFNNQGDAKWFLYNESIFTSESECTQFDLARPTLLLSCIDKIHYDAVLAATN